MTQLYKPLLEKLRLTYPQYLVMVVLWEQQGLGIKDLAEKLHQDSGSITPLVKRLELEGYLVRQRDPMDERSLVLSLTPAGKALQEKAYGVSQTVQMTCGLEHEQFTALMQGLEYLQTRLSN